MTKQYNQQDGAPETEPESDQARSDPNDARPAVVGERSTQEGMAGQGLGQMTDGEGEPKSPETKP
ncbi:MAG TPA: hypothetical protein VE842_18005 [Pyrinomonadaceae bacterium]|jgi:hypothetical protein|nr:hypothetical protein [Pyrinomonadaceae bacterium]